MAKLSTPKSFDKQTLDPDVAKGIDPFIEYVNQNFDQVTRAFFNQITLADNFRGRTQVISVYHGQEIVLEAAGQGIMAALPMSSDSDPIRSYRASRDALGRLKMTFYFDAFIPIQTRSVTASSPFATYEILTSQAIQVGDKVFLSQYGTKSNNGAFMVSGRAESSISVFNPQASTEVKAEFSGVRESPKSIQLYIFYP